MVTFVQLSRKHIQRFVYRISPGISLIVQRSFHERLYSQYKNERSHFELVKDIKLYVGNHRFPLVPLTTEHNYPEIETAPSNEDDESAVRPYSESFSSNSGKWEFRFPTHDESKTKGSRDLCGIKSTLLFEKGYKVLLDYVLLPEDCQDLNDHFPGPVASALYALESFYVKKGYHEMRLKTVCNRFLAKDKSLTETDIASVFANHLFSQLIPCQTNYYLDLQSKGKTDGCLCGCGDILNFGFSQLGSRELFHGSVDLVIFPGEKDVFTDVNNGNKCALFHFKEKGENKGHNKVDKEWYDSEEYTEEGENSGEYKLSGLGFSARRQIYKQAISMSLCKRNRMLNRSISDENEVSITPVCGFNGRSYTMAFYDAEHDYLLKMADSLDLFGDVYLKSSAILDNWLFIYHHLFCSKPPESVLNQLKGSCGLKHHLGERMYEYVLEDSNWRYDLYRPGSKAKSRRILDDIDSYKNIRFMDENIDFNRDARQILKDRLPFIEYRKISE